MTLALLTVPSKNVANELPVLMRLPATGATLSVNVVAKPNDPDGALFCRLFACVSRNSVPNLNA